MDAVKITIDHLMQARRRSLTINTDGARSKAKRARARYDGHLTVVPLARTDAETWIPCEVPNCRSARGSTGGQDYGYRAASAKFLVAGWDLGCYCEKHAREIRKVYEELAPAEEWTSWVAALNAKVARRSP